MMSLCRLAAILTTLVCAIFSTTLQAEDLQKLRKAIEEQKAVLLDVREKVEWDKAHLTAAHFAPLSQTSQDKEAKQFISRWTQDPELKIYCYSNTGKRAQVAADMYDRVGAKVIPLKASYRVLLEAGFKETRGADPKYDPRIKL